MGKLNSMNGGFDGKLGQVRDRAFLFPNPGFYNGHGHGHGNGDAHGIGYDHDCCSSTATWWFRPRLRRLNGGLGLRQKIFRTAYLRPSFFSILEDVSGQRILGKVHGTNEEQSGETLDCSCFFKIVQTQILRKYPRQPCVSF